MPIKTIKATGANRRDARQVECRRIRSIASSTAIETGEAIEVLEEKIKRLHSQPRRVTLA